MAEPTNVPIERLPISIFGTGAMAMLFGARLARAGHAVTLFGSWLEGLSAIREQGVLVEHARVGTSWRASPRVVDLGADPTHEVVPGALALVLVKGPQTPRIASLVDLAVEPSGTVVTLQNGLGNYEALESVTKRRVILGTTTAAARVGGPARVQEVSTGRTVLPASAGEVGELLESAGFSVELVDDIRPHVWLKLAVNCAINPVSALRRVVNGDLLRFREARVLMETAAGEVGEVAAALGLELPADPVEEAHRVARESGSNVSSMLQDVLRGVPTEIENLSGAVVREGRELGVPTPTNEYLLAGVRRLAGAAPSQAMTEETA